MQNRHLGLKVLKKKREQYILIKSNRVGKVFSLLAARTRMLHQQQSSICGAVHKKQACGAIPCGSVFEFIGKFSVCALERV